MKGYCEGIKGMDQPSLFDSLGILAEQAKADSDAISAKFGLTPVHFDGTTYDPALDKERLQTQLGKVYRLMQDGEWRTLAEIAAVAGGSEAGCSARLRDLRKDRMGSYQVERRRRGEGKRGLFEYRMNREESYEAHILHASR